MENKLDLEQIKRVLSGDLENFTKEDIVNILADFYKVKTEYHNKDSKVIIEKDKEIKEMKKVLYTLQRDLAKANLKIMEIEEQKEDYQHNYINLETQLQDFGLMYDEKEGLLQKIK